MSILSEESWDRLIKKVKRIQYINNVVEDEKERNKRKINRPNDFEYDIDFYIKLMNYLEEKHYLGLGFHWGTNTYQEYYWWIEDRELGGTFTTLKNLVEDVLSKFLDVPARDY